MMAIVHRENTSSFFYFIIIVIKIIILKYQTLVRYIFPYIFYIKLKQYSSMSHKYPILRCSFKDICNLYVHLFFIYPSLRLRCNFVPSFLPIQTKAHIAPHLWCQWNATSRLLHDYQEIVHGIAKGPAALEIFSF